ncbi:hypothetical protein [Cognatiluteimonas profundi]|uniref:hypothetical protein n=1 Tax=Cognatiluteimonas profundi TaxID=2594501 RepID=UPI001E5FBB52|nr:hypothetical protein [Lysobacter profundi]
MGKKPKIMAVAGTLMLAAAVGLPRVLALSDTLQGLLYGLAVGLLLVAALRSRMPDDCATGTPALRRRYLREFMPPMLGYVVALFLSLWLLKQIESAWLRGIVALLPLPPIALAMRAIVRYIRDADELQRRIELEAVSIATALVSLLYLAGGFLQFARVIEIGAGIAMLWLFPLVCFTYGVAKVAVTRRYW